MAKTRYCKNCGNQFVSRNGALLCHPCRFPKKKKVCSNCGEIAPKTDTKKCKSCDSYEFYTEIIGGEGESSGEESSTVSNQGDGFIVHLDEDQQQAAIEDCIYCQQSPNGRCAVHWEW